MKTPGEEIPRYCGREGCTKTLTRANKSGLCTKHFYDSKRKSGDGEPEPRSSRVTPPTTKRNPRAIYSRLWEVTASELFGINREHFYVVAKTAHAALIKVAPLLDEHWRVTAANYLGDVRSDLMDFK